MADAQAQERKAAKGIEDLKQSVDKAAESVLGSETESLRMARAELDKLLEEASRDANRGEPAPQKEGLAQGEAKQAEGNNSKTAQAGKAGEQAGQKEGDGTSTGKEQEKGQPGQGKGQEESKEPSKEGGTAQAQPVSRASSQGLANNLEISQGRGKRKVASQGRAAAG
ncbi:hypothetical protein [Verrucomicrobium spinosum]|uniref:hypothetical protein n=1 Tax=Verrucomicrobium spinosum TaxID=2736 RepID=UPI00094628C4|nr:hypothetical protein [Verrucomicrobium spinosum]